MSVKERIKEFVKYLKMSDRAFCKSIGVGETYINSLKTTIHPDKLHNISLQYPYLNIEWLITGNGTMIRDNNINVIKIKGFKLSKDENVNCINCERLKWKLTDVEKDISELKKENRELLEENAVLRFQLEQDMKNTS